MTLEHHSNDEFGISTAAMSGAQGGQPPSLNSRPASRRPHLSQGGGRATAGSHAMLRSIVIFSPAACSARSGIAVGIFVYPYLFLADIVAAEQVEGREARELVATGSFVHVNPSDPIHYGRAGSRSITTSCTSRTTSRSGRGPSSTSTWCRPPRSPRPRRSAPACSSTSAGCAPSRAARTTRSRPASRSPEFGSVVIWCEQFGVLISPATLKLAGS